MEGKPCTEIVVSVDVGGNTVKALATPMKVEVLREQLHISNLQSFADLQVELPLAVTAQGKPFATRARAITSPWKY